MQSTGQHGRSRLLRRLALAVGHLLLAFAVVCGIARSGARYFYCEALGLLPYDPCVQGAQSHDANAPERALREQLPDCCTVLTLPSVPAGERVVNPSVLSAPLVALLPALPVFDSSVNPELHSAKPFFERWRPPPRAASQIRAQRMVFLT
ncbi:MAG: hypothetical protein M3O46_19085 [Myxococcota bacterium]|nr:hypothetical protein [Myxococcota bacterium]